MVFGDVHKHELEETQKQREKNSKFPFLLRAAALINKKKKKIKHLKHIYKTSSLETKNTNFSNISTRRSVVWVVLEGSRVSST